MGIEQEYNWIIENLIGRMELMRRSGITGIAYTPGLSAGASPALKDTLTGLNKEMEGCCKCPLRKGGSVPVAGAGNSNAGLMFVGDSPADEDEMKTGPFSGPRGALLTKILNAMGFEKKDVYLTYALKCKTHSPVHADEGVSACRELLLKEISMVSPRVVVALGHSAALYLLGDSGIREIRGRFHIRGGVKIMPTWPLDELIKKESLKKETWDDMKMVMKELKK